MKIEKITDSFFELETVFTTKKAVVESMKALQKKDYKFIKNIKKLIKPSKQRNSVFFKVYILIEVDSRLERVEDLINEELGELFDYGA